MGIVELPSAANITQWIVFEDQIELPAGLRTFEDFRHWTSSVDFPNVVESTIWQDESRLICHRRICIATARSKWK